MKDQKQVRQKGSKPAPVPQPKITLQTAPESTWRDGDLELESAVAQAIALLDSQARQIRQLREDFVVPGSIEDIISWGTHQVAGSVGRQLLAESTKVYDRLDVLRSMLKGGSL
jgi:hypothetical protein